MLDRLYSYLGDISVSNGAFRSAFGRLYSSLWVGDLLCFNQINYLLCTIPWLFLRYNILLQWYRFFSYTYIALLFRKSSKMKITFFVILCLMLVSINLDKIEDWLTITHIKIMLKVFLNIKIKFEVFLKISLLWNLSNVLTFFLHRSYVFCSGLV